MTPTTPQTTPVTPPPVSKPHRRKPGRSVVLHCVSWEMYTRLRKIFDEKRGVKLTYDQGDLEIMAPSTEHEDDAESLADLIKILTEELGLDIRRGGSSTLKRRRLMKGLEPDKCYWIANAAKVVGMKRLDLRIYPPPDLAVEVDVTHSSLDRFGIYAKLGVPELWRLDGDDLRFHTLAANKKYTEVATSPTFPGFAPSELMVFVKQARTVTNQNVVSSDFRAWLRQRIANPPPPRTPPPPP